MEHSQGIDTRFAAQIGGYLSNTVNDLTHTQDFITHDQINTALPQGTLNSLGEISYTLQELLGDRINAALVFQNYKINSLTSVINVNTREINGNIFAEKVVPQLQKSKSMVIMDMIKAGERSSKIVAMFPSMLPQIMKLMRYRPPRQHKTQCLYIYGPTGLGKTTCIDRCLTTFQKIFKIDYYKKLRGLSKFWDSYDNEPIVYIDDPVKANVQYNEDDVQGLKNILSSGPCIADIKFGSMNFDSKLVIIAANISPEMMAMSMGRDNQEPMLRNHKK